MNGIGSKIVKSRKIIVLIAILLCIPAMWGFVNTPVNYNTFDYIPKNVESTLAQNIIDTESDGGEMVQAIVDTTNPDTVLKIKENLEALDGVSQVMWIDDFFDVAMPTEMIDEEIRSMFISNNTSMLYIVTSAEYSGRAFEGLLNDMKSVTEEDEVLFAGMSVMTYDMKDVMDREMLAYMLGAGALVILFLIVNLESIFAPFIILISIGIGIVYNMGTNMIFGEISFVTASMAAALQLGVTMDFAIFLYHRYEEEKEKYEDKYKAMAVAIEEAAQSILASSMTTVAGFLALCLMQFTIGFDLGLVMAKGVIIGVVATLTILPSLMLICDKLLSKGVHKTMIPKFDKLSNFIVYKRKFVTIAVLVIGVIAFYGSSNHEMYYNLMDGMPQDMNAVMAVDKMKDEFGVASTHNVLIEKTENDQITKQVLDEISELEGVTDVLAIDALLGPRIPREFIPKELLDIFEVGNYDMAMVNSEYIPSSDESRQEINDIKAIGESKGIEVLLAGEPALTDDLITVTDRDFIIIDIVSSILVFIVVAIISKSLTVPLVLVIAVKYAVAVNTGIAFYLGEDTPFMAMLMIGSIQLGATIDYAILMTTRYREELMLTDDKYKAMVNTINNSAGAIWTGALVLFGAMLGAGLVTTMSMTGSIVMLIARGAIVSMITIIVVLPLMLMWSAERVKKMRRFE